MTDAASDEPSTLSGRRGDVLRPGRSTIDASPYHHLLWTAFGVLTVEAERRTWLVPTTLALWLPAGTQYAVTCSPGPGHWVAVAPRDSCVAWVSPTVVDATGFVRESIARLADTSLSASPEFRSWW